MAEDQSDKYSSCDPAAPVSNRRSGRLKPWPEFLRSLSAARLIWSCNKTSRGKTLAAHDEKIKEAISKEEKKHQGDIICIVIF